MVKVREDRPTTADGKFDKDTWTSRLIAVAQLDQPRAAELLQSAVQLAEEVEPLPGDQLTGWGEGYSSQLAGLEMAEILADLHLDCDTLVAAVLYRSVREKKLSLDDVQGRFGSTVAKLITGVARMAAISTLSNHSNDAVMGLESSEQADNVRKMLVAMVDDVRIALIKLFPQVNVIAAFDRIDHFIRFFQCRGSDCSVSLFQVPRAAVNRIPQTCHQV